MGGLAGSHEQLRNVIIGAMSRSFASCGSAEACLYLIAHPSPVCRSMHHDDYFVSLARLTKSRNVSWFKQPLCAGASSF